jgi:hypothetical protein
LEELGEDSCSRKIRQKKLAKYRRFGYKPFGIRLAFLTTQKILGKLFVTRDCLAMRTLLRNVSNGLYFRGPDQWTSNPAEALNFKLIDSALDFVRKWNLKGVELAFAFADVEKVTRVAPEKIEVHYSEM